MILSPSILGSRTTSMEYLFLFIFTSNHVREFSILCTFMRWYGQLNWGGAILMPYAQWKLTTNECLGFPMGGVYSNFLRIRRALGWIHPMSISDHLFFMVMVDKHWSNTYFWHICHLTIGRIFVFLVSLGFVQVTVECLPCKSKNSKKCLS